MSINKTKFKRNKQPHIQVQKANKNCASTNKALTEKKDWGGGGFQ